VTVHRFRAVTASSPTCCTSGSVQRGRRHRDAGGATLTGRPPLLMTGSPWPASP